jgi:hypothetical protein
MKIIVFDVDETLGAFFEFSQYCETTIHNKKLSYPLFRYLLDANPHYLQPNIITVLKYICHHKGPNCKVVMFTNNQGHPIWIQYIKLYLHEKLNYELFDKVVYAKKYEPKRKQESKCLKDFWNCTQYPPNSKVLFIDDQKHPFMLAPNVTYINLPAYNTKTPNDISRYLVEFINQFLNI